MDIWYESKIKYYWEMNGKFWGLDVNYIQVIYMRFPSFFIKKSNRIL